MFDAAAKAFAQMFTPPFRRVLLKSIGLALVVLVLIAIGLQRLLSHFAESGGLWAESMLGAQAHAPATVLVWVLAFAAGLSVITGALFLMPAVTAFVGSFFVDEIAEEVERTHYPAELSGRALPFGSALWQGIKTALLAILVYPLCPALLGGSPASGSCSSLSPTPTCSAVNISCSPRCAFVRRTRPNRCGARIAVAYSSPACRSRSSYRYRSSISPRRCSPWR